MAQQQLTIYVDDLTGKDLPADDHETVSFTLDGVQYEIDLNSKGAAALRNAFARYVANGRRRTPTGRIVRRVQTDVDTRAVRAWARANGVAVSPRGRIAASVVEQYRAAGNRPLAVQACLTLVYPQTTMTL